MGGWGAECVQARVQIDMGGTAQDKVARSRTECLGCMPSVGERASGCVASLVGDDGVIYCVGFL